MNYPWPSLFWLIGALCLLAGGALLTQRRSKLAVYWQVAGGALLAGWFIQLDPFLHLWDERFHALVAKNMASHPFHPKLFATTPLESFHDLTWDKTQTWLHKQPFFLWLMAGSIRIFGAEVWAVRLPSALLWLCAAWATGRAVQLAHGRTAGYLAFLWTMCSGYWGGLAGGFIQLDQNDATFAALVALSMAAWVRFTYHPNRTNAWMTGALAGAAMLTKWLPGGLIFGGWMVYLLTEVPKQHRKQHLSWLAQSLLAGLVVALPWQMYAYLNFPAEFMEEWRYNARHLWEPIEGHDGPWWFQLKQSVFIWGPLMLALAGASLLVFRKQAMPLLKPMVAMALLPLAIYTLAATKMPSFMMVAWFPVCWLAAASGAQLYRRVSNSFQWLRHPVALAGLALTLALVQLQPAQVISEHQHHDPQSVPSHGLWLNRLFWKELEQLPAGVVLNVPGRMYVDCMFYTSHLAYPLMPTADVVRQLLASHQFVYIMLDPGVAPPPELAHLPGIRWLAPPPFNYG